MRFKAKGYILIALFLISFISWMMFNNHSKINNEYLNFGSNIPQSYPVLGIDVSHYQGDINWEQLSLMQENGDSIQFAFIKATEGLSVVDDKLHQNVKGASSNGIDCGLYHYFIPTSSALNQADFFVDESFKSNYSLLPVIDVEIDGGLTKSELLDSVFVFINRVEERTKERPIIYTYSSFYTDYFVDDSRILDENIWIAKYSADCPLMQEDNVLAWQFSGSGTVNGINEKVDLNIAKEDFLDKVRVKK